MQIVTIDDVIGSLFTLDSQGGPFTNWLGMRFVSL